MDPLSDVLSLLKLRSYHCGGMDIGGDFCIGFGQHDGIKCYAVASGQCWLAVDGVEEPILVGAGDCFLLPSGRPFRLASDLSLPPIDPFTILKAPMLGGIACLNGGGDYFGVGGHFALSGKHTDLLLGMLPPVVHLRKEADKATLRFALDRMSAELREPQPGGSLLGQHLAHMILIQALRLHLTEQGGVGWLFALADPQMGPAIQSMHADPARRWGLEELAEQVGMSRSTFARKFKATVGTAPMDYLTRWRMLLAGDRLTHSSDPIAAIATSLGYESESAFSTAFKRVMDCSPRQYSRVAG